MPARLGARRHDPSRNCCACLREVWSADCDTIKPLESSANPLRSDWKLSNHFVIGYSGNLGRAHDIETLLEAISAIDAPKARIPLRCRYDGYIGGGVLFEELRRQDEARLKGSPFSHASD